MAGRSGFLHRWTKAVYYAVALPGGSNVPTMATLIVTSRGWEHARSMVGELKQFLPAASIRRTRFRAVFVLEAQGDVWQLAETVSQKCPASVGRVTAVMAMAPSVMPAIRDAAVRIGREYIAAGQTFSFRLHKRGIHELPEGTPSLESEIGEALRKELERAYGRPPRVNLTDPDVEVVAEVLGPETAVGVIKRSWRETVPGKPLASDAGNSRPSGEQPDFTAGSRSAHRVRDKVDS